MSAHQRWDAELYQSCHSFVWEHGHDLLPLLAPAPGEHILDLGCGSGQLTASIVKTGASVTAVDRSPAMVAQARRNYPDLRVAVADATALPFHHQFDGVFSNAVLHWVKDAGAAAQQIRTSLRTGGRFVAEFGGKGNIQRLLDALFPALRRVGVDDPEQLCPWHFPSLGEYASVLERNGLDVVYARLFERETALEAGPDAMRAWFRMFGGWFLDRLTPEQQDACLSAVMARLRSSLYRGGVWYVDYWRIRIVAIRR